MPSVSKCVAKLATGLLALGLPFVLGDDTSCSFGDYASSIGAGTDQGGFSFCLSKHEQGLLMRKLEVSADKQTVRGIRVTWTDGTSKEAGKMNSEFHETWTQSIEWDPVKEHPTQLDLWTTAQGSDDEGGIGRIRMATSGGATLDISNHHSDGDPNWSADLSKDGTLLGLEGHADFAIDKLNFIISNSRLRKQSIVDMKLNPSVDELNARELMSDRGFHLEKIDSWDFVNEDLTNPVEFGMKKGIKLTTGTTITKSTSDSFELGQGFSFTVSMGIPEVAETELTTSLDMKWSTTNEVSSADSQSKEESVEVEGKIKLETGESATCEAFAYSAQSVDVRWEGRVRLEFEDGTAHLFDSFGEYGAAGFTKGKIICKKGDDGEEINVAKNTGGLGDRETKVLAFNNPEQPDKPSGGDPADSSLGSILEQLLGGILNGGSKQLPAPPAQGDSAAPPPPAENDQKEGLPVVDNLAEGEMPPVVLHHPSKRAKGTRPNSAKFRY